MLEVNMIIGISLIITYLIAMIAAGHGVGPIGLLLIYGDNSAWEGRIAFGWFSIVTLFCLSLPNLKRLRSKGVQLLGIVILYLSWFSFAAAEGGPGWFLGHAILSIPFQITVLISIAVTIYRLKNHTPDNVPQSDA